VRVVTCGPFVTNEWIHVTHLSKPEGQEPLLTGRPVLTKTESVSESVDKITGDYLRLQLFWICPRRIDRLLLENRAQTRS
jgi:hypothetical protein